MKHRFSASWFLRFAACLAVLCAAAPAASAANFDVDSTEDLRDFDPQDGRCATLNGMCTLRAAVEQANQMGYASIGVGSGTYILRKPLAISAKVDLQGAGAGKTLIECGGSRSAALMVKSGGALNLYGFTIQKCLPSENHGDLLLESVSMEGNLGPALRNFRHAQIRSSSFQGNGSGPNQIGGAIVNDGLLGISNSSFEYNATDDTGGALLNRGEASIVLTKFVKNSARSSGGAIYNIGRTYLELTTFDGNEAQQGGGAIVNFAPGEVTALASSFIRNRGSSGGAIFSSSPFYLVSSTVSENRALYGGGLYGAGEPNVLWLFNTTITRNFAVSPDGSPSGEGGGLKGTAILSNTILAGNASRGRGQDCSIGATGGPVSRENNIIGVLDDCGLSLSNRDAAGSLKAPLDPRLLPLDETTLWPPFHEPDAGSLAIDFGNPDGCLWPDGAPLPAGPPYRTQETPLLTDQREYPRELGAACDAGAIEVKQ